MSCACIRVLRSITSSARVACSGDSVRSRSMRTHVRIGESGVRSSCETVARNASLARLAASAAARAASASASAARWSSMSVIEPM